MKTLASAIALAFALTVAVPLTVGSFSNDAVAATKKKVKKAKKKAGKKKSCGQFMYMKKGKCMDARAKK